MRNVTGVLLLFSFFGFAQKGLGKKVFYHAVEGVPNTFDPALGGNLYSSQIIHSVFETLYTYKYLKRPYELTPYLAENFPEISDDGRVYKIRLKRGSYYSDSPCFKNGKGREVTAWDIVYNFKRQFDPKTRATGNWLWQGKILGIEEWVKAGADYSKDIPGIKATDSHTLEFRLTRNFPQFLHTLAMSQSAVYPKEFIDHFGKESGTNPIGSGPFRMKSYSHKKIVLEKNPNFRPVYIDLNHEGYSDELYGFTGIKKLQGKKIPLVDEVRISFIDQGTTRWFSFTKNNEIQYQLVSPKVYGQIYKSPESLELKESLKNKFHMARFNSPSNNYYEFNLSYPETGYHKDPEQNKKNKALRCAVRKVFEWDKRPDGKYSGGVVFPGIIPPGIDGFDPGFSKDSVTYSPKAAAEILKKNGWNAGNLPKLEFSFVTGVTNSYEFERVRANLSSIGWPKKKISAKLYPSYGHLYQEIVKGNAQIVGNVVWHLDYPDAENIFQLFYSLNKSPGVNSSHYNNPEFDRMFVRSGMMMPGPERTKLYQKMNLTVHDDCVWISGFAHNYIHTWKKEVTLYPMQGMMGLTLKYVDVEPDSRAAARK